MHDMAQQFIFSSRFVCYLRVTGQNSSGNVIQNSSYVLAWLCDQQRKYSLRTYEHTRKRPKTKHTKKYPQNTDKNNNHNAEKDKNMNSRRSYVCKLCVVVTVSVFFLLLSLVSPSIFYPFSNLSHLSLFLECKWLLFRG